MAVGEGDLVSPVSMFGVGAGEGVLSSSLWRDEHARVFSLEDERGDVGLSLIVAGKLGLYKRRRGPTRLKTG